MIFDEGPDRALGLVGESAGGAESTTDVLDQLSDEAALAMVEDVETLARRVGYLQASLIDQIERRRLHAGDGHVSAKVAVRHRCRLSATEAAARDKTRQVLARLPMVRSAYASGALGTDQVRLLGRIHANRRVAPQMPDHDTWFVEQAQTLSYPDFEQVVRQWERLTDVDGAEPISERNHERRDFTLTQDHFGLGWEIGGGFGSLTGAAMDEIFQKYLNAEWEADWEKARAERGDDATVADLPRTDAQRRADAAWAIFQDAASTEPGAATPRFVHNIVWDSKSYEQMVQELDGRPRQPLDPEGFRCSTIDGVPISPSDAIMNSLVNEIRRVVVDAHDMVIDLGSARCFTGMARLAAQLQATRCAWVGCLVRTSRCEIDHRVPHGRGGSTNPGNGAPLCGRHNRWKQKGFRVWRDPAGAWHTYRPDGTEI